MLDEAGFLSGRTSAVHATHLTDVDVGLLGSSATYSCFCPTTERDLADGIGPSVALRDAGSPLTLGSDSHAVIDLFEEMRAVELDERLASQERGHWSAAELLRRQRSTGTARSASTDAGRDRGGCPRRPGRGPAWTACVRRGPAGPWRPWCSPRRPPMSPTWWCPGGMWLLMASIEAGCGRRAGHLDRGGDPMTSLLLTGIGSLVTNDPARGGLLGEIADAALVIEGSKVAWVGSRREAPAADSALDLGGRAVIPGFVDSHSHLVFAGDRAEEFAARMTGTPYSAGGIRTTVAATRQATDEVADRERGPAGDRDAPSGHYHSRDQVRLRADGRGRGASAADRGQFTDETTYLGAHVVPAEYADDPAGYVSLVTGPMLDAVAEYAKWIDVFVERGAFDEDQARTILTGRSGAGHARAGACQPARRGAWRPARVRGRCGRGRSLHLPHRCRHRRFRLDWRSRRTAPRDRVLHAVAVPRCPPPARRRRHSSPRHRLQPRLRLLLLDAFLHRARRPRDAHDPRRGPLVRDSRRCRLAPPYRPGPPDPRRPRRPGRSSTPPLTYTSPTAREFPSSPRPSSAVVRCEGADAQAITIAAARACLGSRQRSSAEL